MAQERQIELAVQEVQRRLDLDATSSKRSTRTTNAELSATDEGNIGGRNTADCIAPTERRWREPRTEAVD